MRLPALTIAASLALLAAPAFAQSSSTTGTNTDQNGNPSYSTNSMSGRYNQQNGYTNSSNNGTGTYNQQYGSNGNSNGWDKGANVTMNTRDRIRDLLQQSGFRDVRVMPEAFVIHALAPDGSHIVMLLRPDELTGVIEQTGSSTGPGNWNNQSSTMNGGSNGWNNGSSNTNNSTGR